mgnify:CR=1 FL=1
MTCNHSITTSTGNNSNKKRKLLKSLGTKINQKITEYHQFFRTPPKGEHFEDLVSQCFLEMDNSSHGWFDGDHTAGTDIWDSPLGNLSLKTNKLYGKNVIRTDISSYRLTTFGDKIAEMLDYIDSKDSDYYLLCTRRTDRGMEYEEAKKRGDGYEEYEIFLIPSNFVSVHEYEWKPCGAGWKAEVSPGFTLLIIRSMSNQFWIKGIPYDKVKPYSFQKVRINHTQIPYKLMEVCDDMEL